MGIAAAMTLDDATHGPSLRQQRAHTATLADHYGHGWLAGRAALDADNRRLRARVEDLERTLADIRRLTEAR